MKPQILLTIPRDSQHNIADPWFENMPRILHTAAARHLFETAAERGILEYYEELGYFKGVGITLPQLAYWCICASTYLGLDRGPTETTYWKPFEKALNQKPKSLSRATRPLDLDRDPETHRPMRDNNGWPLARELYAKDITAFFNALTADTSTENR